ncbi:hypothetical protein [Leifsonia sp. NPDC058248]|uniref:hypothetical protein n=1 Tax=Leifsonia sp. NPDC058248 TaxID=3346402 RepID=UPI0036DA9511
MRFLGFGGLKAARRSAVLVALAIAATALTACTATGGSCAPGEQRVPLTSPNQSVDTLARDLVLCADVDTGSGASIYNSGETVWTADGSSGQFIRSSSTARGRSFHAFDDGIVLLPGDTYRVPSTNVLWTIDELRNGEWLAGTMALDEIEDKASGSVTSALSSRSPGLRWAWNCGSYAYKQLTLSNALDPNGLTVEVANALSQSANAPDCVRAVASIAPERQDEVRAQWAGDFVTLSRTPERLSAYEKAAAWLGAHGESVVARVCAVIPRC